MHPDGIRQLLKIHRYGYLNRIQSCRRLEREVQRNIHVAPDLDFIRHGRDVESVVRARDPWHAEHRVLLNARPTVVFKPGSPVRRGDPSSVGWTPMWGMLLVSARWMILSGIAYASAVNLYEMYVANDMKVGFWLKRRTWGDLCARVTFVGEIEQHGSWFGGASVRADIFHFISGKLKEADATLPAPGSPKTWQRIPPPPLHAWRRSAKHLPGALVARR